MRLRIKEEALLRNLCRSALGRAECQQRNARLRNKAVHHLIDRLAAGFRLRIPEVLGGRIAVHVRFKIIVHALAENLRSFIILRHRQHGTAFLIGDAVEHLVNLAWRIRLGSNRPSHFAGIIIQHAVQIECFVLRKIPFRLPCRNRLRFHPGGKALVQPQIVPPFHGDHIAEPLVRHLVRHVNGHGFLRIGRRGLFDRSGKRSHGR